MRFDDKLDTVFAQPAADQAALVVAWMQIVDILAQARAPQNGEQRAEAFARLKQWRHRVPAERRRTSAYSLAGRQVPADLVAFIGDDVPQVAAALLPSVQLSHDDWAAILPGLPPASRALLRERRDLAPDTRALLQSFGSSDFALPADDSHEPVTDNVAIQIRDLVARIEAFRKDRPFERLPETALDAETVPDSFRFETGAEGTINWVEGAPRGAIIGIEIATMAEIGAHGVDGHAAGAFRRRTPFRNARMVVPGNGAVCGEWIISGLPCFNERDGRFFGYRCTARRPERTERPMTNDMSILGSMMPPDSLRQLVHELRTPLNAIRGFAEMIQGQLIGPVSIAYREKAIQIVNESSRLLQLFEDLDIAAKLERGVMDVRGTKTANVNEVMHAVAGGFTSLTNARQIHLRLAVATNLPDVGVDPLTVERMFTRLLGATIGLSQTGETINAVFATDRNAVVLRIDRPLGLAGQTERELFDPSFDPVGDWSDPPALGLGFALRLVANMARLANGRLVVTDDTFALFLPARDGETGDTRNNQQ